MNPIDYRLLNADDLDRYREIRLDCLKNNPDSFGSTYEEVLRAPASKMSRFMLQPDLGGFLAGAFQDKRLIGICAFTQGDRIKTRHRGDLTQMYVAPSYQGRGSGTGLLRFVLQIAFSNPVIEQVELGVVDSNAGALALYRRNGFVRYGRLKNCFKQAGDYRALVLMVLTRPAYGRNTKPGANALIRHQ